MKWAILCLFGLFSYGTKTIQEDISCMESPLYEKSEAESQGKNKKQAKKVISKPKIRDKSKKLGGFRCGTAWLNMWQTPSPTEQPLHWAVLNGNLEKVKESIKSGVDVNSTYFRGHGKTALHLAKDLEIVKLLIKQGANVNAKDRKGKTPLHHLVNQLEIVKLLIKQGANVNAKDRKGKTPLHHLVNQLEIAKLLIKQGANVNAKDEKGKTPLHLADHLDIVKILVKNGANVNAKDKFGNSPLFYKSLDITSFLLEKGSYINSQNKAGETLLHKLAPGNERDFKLISFLINKSLDVNIKDNNGNTALYFVNNLEMAIFLREKGVNPSPEDISRYKHGKLNTDFYSLYRHQKTDPKKFEVLREKAYLNRERKNKIFQVIKSENILKLAINWLDVKWVSRLVNPLDQEEKNKALLYAIDKSSFLYTKCNKENKNKDCENLSANKKKIHAILSLLIKSGADVNERDKEGKTPLYKVHDPKSAQLFIEGGANVKVRDKEGNTLLHVVKTEGVAKLLLDSGAKINVKNNFDVEPLFTLLSLLTRGWIKSNVITFLIKRGADIKVRDKSGNTLLHASGRPEVTKLLIEKGLNVNAKNKAGVTPLLYLAPRLIYYTRPKTLKLLIESGADVNIKNQYGENLLHIVSYPEIIELLVKEKKMDINSKGHLGNSVLHSAITRGRDLKFIQFLIELGADIHHVNTYGYTPLHFVTSYHLDIAKFLIDKGLDVNAKTKSGETLLHTVFAHAWGHKNYIKFLVKKGANINARDNAGETPIYRALQSRVNLENLQFLVEQGVKLDVLNNKGERPCDKAKDKEIRKFIKEKKGCSILRKKLFQKLKTF